jgi:hypothetical protein
MARTRRSYSGQQVNCLKNTECPGIAVQVLAFQSHRKLLIPNDRPEMACFAKPSQEFACGLPTSLNISGVSPRGWISR